MTLFLRVTLDDGRDHLYNFAHIKAIFPFKGTRLALAIEIGGVEETIYTKNDFQQTVNNLYDPDVDSEGMVVNAAPHS